MKDLEQDVYKRQEVYHAGKIGIDGQFLIELCNDSGVNSTFIETGVIPTGNAIIQVTSQGQNSIILYPGANRSLDKAWIDKVLTEFSKGDILLPVSYTHLDANFGRK